MDTPENTLTLLNQQLSEAEQKGDKSFFEKHLADTLIFRRASGKIVGKKDFLAALKPNNYDYNVPSDMQINVADDGLTAAVSLIISAKIKDPQTEGQWRNIRLFQKNNDVWQITGWYNEPA
jgi:hypothetical protein